jgi:hypothetical protein
MTLPLQPVLLGALVALIPGMPISVDPATVQAKVLYYSASGMISTWLFAIVKSLAKTRL